MLEKDHVLMSTRQYCSWLLDYLMFKPIMPALCWHTKNAYYAQSNASILCSSLITSRHATRNVKHRSYTYSHQTQTRGVATIHVRQIVKMSDHRTAYIWACHTEDSRPSMVIAGVQPSNGPRYVGMLRPTPYVLCIRYAGVRTILVSDIWSLTLVLHY